MAIMITKLVQHYFFLSLNTREKMKKKRQNLNFVYTLHHIMVIKTILACTAVYNAHTCTF